MDGLICVNNRAGGHAGTLAPKPLLDSLEHYNLLKVCAGGISTPKDYQHALSLGYAGIQCGTRFIASLECTAHNDYKQAILNAQESDIVLSEKITGVPVSVINTPYIQSQGTKPNAMNQYLLKANWSKHLMRLYYALRSLTKLKKSLKQGSSYKEYYQAGKSVAGIKQVESVQEIMSTLTQAS